MWVTEIKISNFEMHIRGIRRGRRKVTNVNANLWVKKYHKKIQRQESIMKLLHLIRAREKESGTCNYCEKMIEKIRETCELAVTRKGKEWKLKF